MELRVPILEQPMDQTYRFASEENNYNLNNFPNAENSFSYTENGGYVRQQNVSRSNRVFRCEGQCGESDWSVSDINSVQMDEVLYTKIL